MTPPRTATVRERPGTRSLFFHRLPEVEYPRDAKPIHKHPITDGPKRLLQGHRDLAVFAERRKEPFNLVKTLTLDHHREVIALLERRSGHNVHTHQERVSLRKRRMQDPVRCFPGPIARCFGVPHEEQFGLKTPLIEFHRFAAVSVKAQIGDDVLHHLLRSKGRRKNNFTLDDWRTWRTHSCVPRRQKCRRPLLQGAEASSETDRKSVV